MRKHPEVERRHRLDLPGPGIEEVAVHPADEPRGMELQVLARPPALRCRSAGGAPVTRFPRRRRRRSRHVTVTHERRRPLPSRPPRLRRRDRPRTRIRSARHPTMKRAPDVGRVLEVRHERRLLLALLAAAVAVAAEPRIVRPSVPVEKPPAAPGPLERRRHQSVAGVGHGGLGIDAEALPDGVLCGVELRLVDALHPVAGPLLADVVRQPEADERVHERSAAERATGEDSHPAGLGPDDPTVQVRPRSVVQLFLQEVGFARVAALLEDDDRQPRLLESRRDDGAACARADHAGVGGDRVPLLDRVEHGDPLRAFLGVGGGVAGPGYPIADQRGLRPSSVSP